MRQCGNGQSLIGGDELIQKEAGCQINFLQNSSHLIQSNEETEKGCHAVKIYCQKSDHYQHGEDQTIVEMQVREEEIYVLM